MTSTSFASANTVNLDFSRNGVVPYDKTLRFNRIIDRREDKPESVIYSIDERSILKAIDEDLEALHRITLAGQYIRSGVGIWDALFNYANKQVLSACILTASSSYLPLPDNRIVVSSPFIDGNKPVCRIYLNQISQGDQIGIGINDVANRTIYVLLYTVDNHCLVPNKAVGNTESVGFVPAVNVRLEHALMIDENDNANLVTVPGAKDYDSDKARPFVEWICNTVYAVHKGYAWKPHFTPVTPIAFERDKLEKRLAIDCQRAELISFDDFDTECRRIYKTLRHHPKAPRRRPSAREKVATIVPQVEVVTRGTDYVTVRFSDNVNPDGKIWKINADEIQRLAPPETFLANKDLNLSHILESPNVMELSPDEFGPHCYVRYFWVRF